MNKQETNKVLRVYEVKWINEDNTTTIEKAYLLDIKRATKEQLEKYGDGDDDEGEHWPYYLCGDYLIGVDMCTGIDILNEYISNIEGLKDVEWKEIEEEEE